MTLRRFKTKAKKKSIEELIETLVILNRDYYLCIKLVFENPFPPHPEEDARYITILERKMNYINTLIHRHLVQQNRPNLALNQPSTDSSVVELQFGTPKILGSYLPSSNS